jgi:hypothetical protein
VRFTDRLLRLGGDGGWHAMTWLTDGRQHLVVCDGCGWRPTIAPAWIAEDGHSFWLAWTDFQHTDEYRGALLHECHRAPSEEDFTRLRREYRRTHPYFGLNLQRVEIEAR